jgi:hypothetical protein
VGQGLFHHGCDDLNRRWQGGPVICT